MRRLHRKRASTRARPDKYIHRGVIEPFELRLAKLDEIATHVFALHQAGMHDLARGATNAWLRQALFFAAAPAATIKEASLKTAYLQTCLSYWIIPLSKALNKTNPAAMLVGAVAVEERRWGLATTPGQTH